MLLTNVCKSNLNLKIRAEAFCNARKKTRGVCDVHTYTHMHTHAQTHTAYREQEQIVGVSFKTVTQMYKHVTQTQTQITLTKTGIRFLLNV